MANVKTSQFPANQALASGDLVDLTQNVATVLTSVQATMIEVADFVNQQAWAANADAGGFDLTNVGLVDGKDVAGHVDDATIHFTEAGIDHGSVAGLGDDDHTQYVLADGTRAISTTLSASSGAETLLSVTPTVNQSGTAGYTGLLVDVTETATGSGAKEAIRLDVGGSPVARISNTGATFVSGAMAVGQASDADSNALLHVFDSDPSGAASAVGDLVQLERSGGSFINFLGGATDISGVVFSDNVVRNDGSILYNRGENTLTVRANSGTVAIFGNNGLALGRNITIPPGDVFTVTTPGISDMFRIAAGKVGIGRGPHAFDSHVLQVHRNATTECWLQLGNNSTGTTSTDGVLFGVSDSSGTVVIRNQENSDIRIETNTTERMRVEAGGSVEIATSPSGAAAGKLHVNQESATGAIPVLALDQNDLSEEFIRLIGESAVDASQSLVDAADLTTPGAIQGWFKVYVQDDAGTGPITDGVYYVPFYSAPTA